MRLILTLLDLMTRMLASAAGEFVLPGARPRMCCDTRWLIPTNFRLNPLDGRPYQLLFLLPNNRMCHPRFCHTREEMTLIQRTATFAEPLYCYFYWDSTADVYITPSNPLTQPQLLICGRGDNDGVTIVHINVIQFCLIVF
jgi:hypothetical protein